jgi:hypothetical protein
LFPSHLAFMNVLWTLVCKFESLLSIFFFLWCWGLNLGATPWALFCVRYFQNRVLWTICLGWVWTMILLISATWVPRITGVSHQHLALLSILLVSYLEIEWWALW